MKGAPSSTPLTDEEVRGIRSIYNQVVRSFPVSDSKGIANPMLLQKARDLMARSIEHDSPEIRAILSLEKRRALHALLTLKPENALASHHAGALGLPTTVVNPLAMPHSVPPHPPRTHTGRTPLRPASSPDPMADSPAAIAARVAELPDAPEPELNCFMQFFCGTRRRAIITTGFTVAALFSGVGVGIWQAVSGAAGGSGGVITPRGMFVDVNITITDHDGATALPTLGMEVTLPVGSRIGLGDSAERFSGIDDSAFALVSGDGAAHLRVLDETRALAAYGAIRYTPQSNRVPPDPSEPFASSLQRSVPISLQDSEGSDVTTAPIFVETINTDPVARIPVVEPVSVHDDRITFPIASTMTEAQALLAAEDLNMGQGSRLILACYDTETVIFQTTELMSYVRATYPTVSHLTLFEDGEIDPASLTGEFAGNVGAAEAFLASHGIHQLFAPDTGSLAYAPKGHFIKGVAAIVIDSDGNISDQHGFDDLTAAESYLDSHDVTKEAGIILIGADELLGPTLRQGQFKARRDLAEFGEVVEVSGRMRLYDRLGASVEVITDTRRVEVTKIAIILPVIDTEPQRLSDTDTSPKPIFNFPDGFTGSTHDIIRCEIPANRTLSVVGRSGPLTFNSDHLTTFPGLAALNASSVPVSAYRVSDADGGWLRLVGSADDISTLLTESRSGAVPVVGAGQTGINTYSLPGIRFRTDADNLPITLEDRSGTVINPDHPGVLPAIEIEQTVSIIAVQIAHFSSVKSSGSDAETYPCSWTISAADSSATANPYDPYVVTYKVISGAATLSAEVATGTLPAIDHDLSITPTRGALGKTGSITPIQVQMVAINSNFPDSEPSHRLSQTTEIMVTVAPNTFSFAGEIPPAGITTVVSGHDVLPYAATDITFDADQAFNVGDEIFARIEIKDPINTGYPDLIAAGWVIETIEDKTYARSPAATTHTAIAALNTQVKAARLALGIGPKGIYYGPGGSTLPDVDLSDTLTYWRNDESSAFSPSLAGKTIRPEIPTPMITTAVASISNKEGDTDGKPFITGIDITGPEIEYCVKVQMPPEYLGSAEFPGGEFIPPKTWAFNGTKAEVNTWLTESFRLLPEPNAFDPDATPPSNGQTLDAVIALSTPTGLVPTWNTTHQLSVIEFDDRTESSILLEVEVVKGTEHNPFDLCGVTAADLDEEHQTFLCEMHVGYVDPPPRECTEIFPGFNVCSGGTNDAFKIETLADAMGRQFVLDPASAPDTEGAKWTDTIYRLEVAGAPTAASLEDIFQVGQNTTKVIATDDAGDFIGKQIEVSVVFRDRVTGDIVSATPNSTVTNIFAPDRRLLRGAEKESCGFEPIPEGLKARLLSLLSTHTSNTMKLCAMDGSMVATFKRHGTELDVHFRDGFDLAWLCDKLLDRDRSTLSVASVLRDTATRDKDITAVLDVD